MDVVLCGLKWIASGLAFPVCGMAGLWLIAKVLNAVATEKPKPKRQTTQETERVVESIVVAFFMMLTGIAVAATIYLSARAILPMFGCDDCLPRAWQKQCAASSADALEEADRKAVAVKVTEIRATCDRWAWDTCPVGGVE